MTILRRGLAHTEHGSRYLQQLCKHWSHKFETSFSDLEGTIALPLGRVDLEAQANDLCLTLNPKAAADLERLQQVVEDHLNRFAFREAPLPFSWRDEES